jgi:serine protease
MHNFTTAWPVVALATFLLLAAAPIIKANDDSHRLIIKFRDAGSERTAQSIGQDRLQLLADRSGHQLSLLRHRARGSTVATLQTQGTQSWREALDELNDDAAVEYAIEDKRMRPQFTPNDPLYAAQWNLIGTPGGMDMESAWDIERGSASVTVAIIDTGYQAHPDFDETRIKAQHDFVDDDISALDPGDGTENGECGAGIPGENSSWHGTLITGLIAATTNNLNDIAGITHSGRLVIARGLGKCGGFASDTTDAMRWAAGITVAGVPINPHPADVINLSFAGDGLCDPGEQAAINDVIAAGAVVVVAAGNSGGSTNNVSPANCDDVITVTAIEIDGSLADYSNTGSHVDVSAPGGDSSPGGVRIDSLSNTGTSGPVAPTIKSSVGTSIATAHVTGVAALMKAARPALTPAVLRQLLIDNTRAFPNVSCNTALCGSGIIDPVAAVLAAINAATTGTMNGQSDNGDNGGSGGSGGSSGGCSISTTQNPDISLLLLLSGLALFRINRQSRT